MPTLPEAPTEAAAALDVTDLPIGTFVRWTVDHGFGRSNTKKGEVVALTDKMYVVRTYWLQETTRVRRDPDNLTKRHLRAVATPEEWKAIKDEIRAEGERAQVERAARFKAEQEEQRQRRARDKAMRAFAEANPTAFQEYLDRALEEEK